VTVWGGQGPFDYITMGGMFTILKVRDQLADGEDAGWYKNPAETVAATASNADLRADDITIPRPTRYTEHQGPGHAGHRNMSR